MVEGCLHIKATTYTRHGILSSFWLQQSHMQNLASNQDSKGCLSADIYQPIASKMSQHMLERTSFLVNCPAVLVPSQI